MSEKAKRLFLVTLIATLAAIATHVYLTNHHYEFKYGQGTEGGICNISSTMNCDTTTASQYSEFFGIPVSIFGGLINFAFLLLLLLYRFPVVKRETQIALGGTLKLMALGIFIVSVVMALLSYFVLKTVCPACTTAYVLSLVTLGTTWLMVSERQALFSKLDLKVYPIVGVSVLLFAMLIHKNNMRSYGGDEQLEIIELQVNQWKKTPAQNFTPATPLVLNANESSKMKIVEFADFLCGHCANAYPVIHRFVKSHPDVQFSFQAWPLDGECNKAIPHSEGTRCLLARVSQCAGRQDAPWKTQEWIFANQRQLLSKDMVTSQLKGKASELGLNYDELMSCADSEEVREIIRNQANVGVELNISGTPAIFINGKKVPGGFSTQLLEKLYREVTR